MTQWTQKTTPAAGLPTLSRGYALGILLSAFCRLYFFLIRQTISPSVFGGTFPGSPVVRTLPSSTGAVGLIPGWGVKISLCAVAKKKKNSHKTEAIL